MKFIDITVPLSIKTIAWEGDLSFELKQVAKATPGKPSSYNLSRLDMNVHLGTHVDAPLHFVHEGSDVPSMDLDALVGPARVIDLRGQGFAIDKEKLQNKKIGHGERILLKTDNGELYDKGKFSREFAYLTKDAAKYLRDNATKLVGIDYLSVDPRTDPKSGFEFTAHHLLLDPRDDGTPSTIILESIDLRNADEGEYELVCLPIKIVGAEGAPARAILIRK